MADFDCLTEEYVFGKKLEWAEELDKARQETITGLKGLRDEAHSELQRIKLKVHAMRELSKEVESRDNDELLVKEQASVEKNGHFSIVRPTECLT